MIRRAPLPLAALALIAGCKIIQPMFQPEVVMNAAGDKYLACLNAEAEKNMGNPTTAENIANAAHAACWSQWQAYRDATENNYIVTAKTAQEAQLANDKTHAHLRQFEFEARKAVMSRVVERTLGVKKTAP